MTVAFGILAAVIPASARDYPEANISNGTLRAEIYLPDMQKGFYCGTRFDWSGVVADVEYKHHHYFGPFFQKFDSAIPDIALGTDIAAGPNSAATGPVEEFISADGTALGYAEAKVGGAFCKIGVGLLEKPAEPAYSSFQNYKIVTPGIWSVRKGKGWIEFVQKVTSDFGYAYEYRKTIRLVKNSMLVEHRLTNLGQKVIQTDVYDHNFVIIDHEPSGPDVAVKFNFRPRATADMNGLGEIRNDRLVFLKELKNDDTLYTPLEGFGTFPSKYEIRVENHETSAGLKITGDQPLSKLVFWSIRSVVAPETFTHLKIEPGRSYRWKYEYKFYTVADNRN